MPRRVRYESADRVWLAALARLIPRNRWAEVFPVTPATPLAWHRRLAVKRYDASKRRKPDRPSTVPGIDPAPCRAARVRTWRQFLPAQAAGIVAVDLLHADTVLLRRLTCERHVGTPAARDPGRMLIPGRQHLHAVLTEYQAYYITARPHQGIAQRVPDDDCNAPRATGSSRSSANTFVTPR
jgi:hypothetical protein